MFYFFLSLSMRFFSTFSGIGGFEIALEEAGHECVGFSEIDPHAISVYISRFPHINHGDITRISAESLPDFDLLCGGFPCQAFSVAGEKRGFEDTRGTLFFDLCRIARTKKPRYLLFENVKGLLSHDRGNTFATILISLDELGYDVQWQVLNSKHFGVPQNRERVYILGHLRGTPRPDVFPLIPTSRAVIGEARCIAYQNKRHVSTLSDCVGTITSSYRGRPDGDGRPGLLLPDGRIRGLTVEECERLQGFPTGWTEGISKSNRYKCVGNAVTVNVVRAIAQRL